MGDLIKTESAVVQKIEFICKFKSHDHCFSIYAGYVGHN